MESVLKIALGVFIGALAAAFTWEGIQAVRVEYALKRASQELQRANADMQRRERDASIARAEQGRQEAAATAAAQRDVEARRAAELQRRAAREDAWKQFYQPSPPCRLDSGTADCANEFMRARKRFDQSYQGG